MLGRRTLVLVVFAVAARPVAAQTLTDDIRQLFTFGTCGEPLCLEVASGHGDHYIPAAQSSGATLIDFLGSAIGVSVSNIPIASSSSGATFRFEGGVPVKTSTSGGPIFAERAQTLGRGKFFVGLSVTATNFERLRGVPLNQVRFNFTHEDEGPLDTLGNPLYENDIVQVKMAMDVSTIVSAFEATWGVVDGLDLGLVVPFVHTSISGNSVAEVIPIGGAIVHYFAGTQQNPVLTAVSATSGSATGLGDVSARLKINIAQTRKVGVGLFADARFPTGDAENLLGAGAFSGRALGIASGTFGNFNPHVNFGYTVHDATLQNNTVDATVGFDQLIASFATMAVDMIGSWEVGQSKLTVPPPVQFQYPVARVVDVTNIPNQQDNLMSLAIGFKFQTQRGMRIVTNALIPLRDSGLQPSVAWTGGLEYNF